VPFPRHRLGWGSFFILMVLVLFFLYAGLTPWALHMGGRSTLDEQWDGFGEVQASNGGRYVLFVHLQGGLLAGSGPSRRGNGIHGKTDNLHGSAELCTESGAAHTFKLTGVVDSWWATDDAPTTLALTGGSPVKLQSGWVVAWRGQWHGPALELSDPDSSFTEAFTRRGEIRHVTSTGDAGTARVTLRYGSHDEFTVACRGIVSH